MHYSGLHTQNARLEVWLPVCYTDNAEQMFSKVNCEKITLLFGGGFDKLSTQTFFKCKGGTNEQE
jgi:hypothetical protein